MRPPKIRSGSKKTAKIKYTPKNGYRWVLVNNKTKRSASSSNWFLALSAVAVINNDVSGLPSLLNHVKAEKLLVKNSLVLTPERTKTDKPIRGKKRQEAKEFIPALAVLYGNQLPSDRPPRRQDFCKWIVSSLRNEKSQSCSIAKKRGYEEILMKLPNWRWWLSRLGKMQS